MAGRPLYNLPNATTVESGDKFLIQQGVSSKQVDEAVLAALYKDHATSYNKNPADGSAHNADDVAKDGGGSVQDFIDAQFTTTTELATGKFNVGQHVRLTDRKLGLFLLQSGRTPDAKGVLDAGNGNTAILVSKPSPYVFGAKGNGTTDDTASVQYFLDYCCPELPFGNYPSNGILTADFDEGGEFLVSNILLRHRLSSNDDLRRWKINANGIKLKQIVGAVGPTLEISSCKRIQIDGGMRVEGETWVTGIWDCDFTGIETNLIVGERFAGGVSLFAANYWNNFTKCRFGFMKFTISVEGVDQEFNANTFYSCKSGTLTLIGNANGSFQGNIWSGGELRGTPVVSVDGPCNSSIPNGLTTISTYFDQTGVQTNLFNFALNTLGSNPNPNGYVMDGQWLADAGSNLEYSLAGLRVGARIPTSASNLIVNGSLQNSAVGETTLEGIPKFAMNSIVNQGAGASKHSRYVSLTSTGQFAYASFRSQRINFEGYYTVTLMYLKPETGALDLKVGISDAGDPATLTSEFFNVLANNSGRFGVWCVASFTLKVPAGKFVHVMAYTSSASARTISLAYCGCTLGSKGMLFATGDDSSNTGVVVVDRGTVPTSGSWIKGSYVNNTNPVLVSGTHYIRGWLRVTTGATNVVGTDWVVDKVNI